MLRRWRWSSWSGAVLAAALIPGAAFAAGPVGGPVVHGQPDDDTRLSVLTPAEAAFMQRKLDMAAAIRAVGTTAAKALRRVVAAPMVACEFDPCEDPPTWPPAPGQPPSGPPASVILNTKTRTQNNSYYCGPATGQIAMNWSRGITSGNLNGENATTNWRKQSTIAGWMKTTTNGTSGANLAAGLNHPQGVLKPTPDWVYAYADSGTQQQLHNKVVTDVAGFAMPLIIATVPHDAGAGVFYLRSWPGTAAGAHHWILIRGYSGLWGSTSPSMSYQDTSGNYGGGTGSYEDATSVMWQVNKWNQGGHIVW